MTCDPPEPIYTPSRVIKEVNEAISDRGAIDIVLMKPMHRLYGLIRLEHVSEGWRLISYSEHMTAKGFGAVALVRPASELMGETPGRLVISVGNPSTGEAAKAVFLAEDVQAISFPLDLSLNSSREVLL